MEILFKKYFWVLQAGFVTAVAFLGAGIIGAVGGSIAAPFSVAVPSLESSAPAEEEVAEVALPTTGIETNPTPPPTPPPDPCADVECEDDEICREGECVPDVAAEPELPEGRCVESDIAINLVGTMVADDPMWSVAILHNPSTSKTQFADVGTNLLEEAQVTRIERNRIFLRRNGREECLRPGDQASRQQRAGASPQPRRPTTSIPSRARPGGRVSATSASPTATRPEPARPASLEERVRTAVTQGADGSYNVPRDLIQQVAGDRAMMEQNAPRVVPSYVNGQPNGFRLQGIRSGSIFSAIGIRNGDVITGVNGTVIDSPQRALSLYEAMLQQENVEIQVLRRGREQTLRYNIQ